jgi:nitroreductase
VSPDSPLGLFEALYTTRALRRIRPDPLPEETIFQVLDAAIRAPTGHNAQDWRFVLITDPDLKLRMRDWAQDGWERYQPRFAENPELIEGLRRTPRLVLKSMTYAAAHLHEVPLLVAACGEIGRHGTPGGSIMPAVQNILLAARGLGLAASIFSLPLVHGAEVREALGVPENYQIYCLIPIGYPVDRHGPVRRKPVKDVVYWNRWDTAWDFAAQQPEEGWHSRWVRTKEAPP